MKDLSDLDSLADQIENAAAEAARAITTIVKDPVVSFNKVTNYGLYGSIALMIGDGSKASAVSDAITRAVAPLVQDDRIQRFEAATPPRHRHNRL